MKTHLNFFFFRFLLFSLGTCTNASHLNNLRCQRECFLPYHTSCGLESTSANKGDIFSRYFAFLTTSAENSYAHPTQLSMILALSINIQFILSKTPFWFRVYGFLFWWFIPHFLQKWLKSFPHNSPPLSFMSTLIFLYVWFSIIDLNSLNFSKTFDLLLGKYIHFFLENSLMRET